MTDHAFTTDFQKADMKSFYMAMKRNSGDAAIKSVTRRKTLNKRQPSRNQVRKNRDWIIVDSWRGCLGTSGFVASEGNVERSRAARQWRGYNVTSPPLFRVAINSKKDYSHQPNFGENMCGSYEPFIYDPQTLFEETNLCPNIRDGPASVCVKN